MLFGDNPFDDGLDFVGCPPKKTILKLPKFPEKFGGDCKLICWARCKTFPDGERTMYVEIEDFRPDPNTCGVYNGTVHFRDAHTGEVWYKGRLKFYYTRNYIYKGKKVVAFRFVAKGDIERVSNDMPEWECLILCTKEQDEIEPYKEIFVYGGLDIVFNVPQKQMEGFKLSLGHNDGWYTHHPECSQRPIAWTGYGDYIGHYCDRGWLFVSPGKTFSFDPHIKPPTGYFYDEALRELGSVCLTENAIQNGRLQLEHQHCIHSYQSLEGQTECDTYFKSAKSCQGLVYSGQKFPWIIFFSMGAWVDYHTNGKQTLHLVEGRIRTTNEKSIKQKEEFYFYGFATQDATGKFRLVDIASNKDTIGAPAQSEVLIYLYSPDGVNPKLRRIQLADPKLSESLIHEEKVALEGKEPCPFLKKRSG